MTNQKSVSCTHTCWIVCSCRVPCVFLCDCIYIYSNGTPKKSTESNKTNERFVTCNKMKSNLSSDETKYVCVFSECALPRSSKPKFNKIVILKAKGINYVSITFNNNLTYFIWQHILYINIYIISCYTFTLPKMSAQQEEKLKENGQDGRITKVAIEWKRTSRMKSINQLGDTQAIAFVDESL